MSLSTWKTTYGFTDRELSAVKPCTLFFIQTLPRILCAGAISRVSFLDLFGPIAGVINPILYNLYKDSCPLIGWFAFIMLTINRTDDKTSYCTPFGSARVQKLFTIALIVYFYIRVFIISNTIFGRLL